MRQFPLYLNIIFAKTNLFISPEISALSYLFISKEKKKNNTTVCEAFVLHKYVLL